MLDDEAPSFALRLRHVGDGRLLGTVRVADHPAAGDILQIPADDGVQRVQVVRLGWAPNLAENSLFSAFEPWAECRPLDGRTAP